jgi:poly [ADP-ribose] polymerase
VRRAFDQKFKDKTGLKWDNRFNPTPSQYKESKYTFIERRYEDDTSDDEDGPPAPSHGELWKQGMPTGSPIKRADSTLPKPVQRLLQLVFNKVYFADAMTEMSYDADKLPLGQLSKRTLQRGFEVLKQLGMYVLNIRVR